MQRAISLILAPCVPLQVQCRVYPMHSQYGTTGIPRYWITLGQEILWDYPRQFIGRASTSGQTPPDWPYNTDISAISCLIRDYLDTPRQCLLTAPFPHDLWGLIPILQAADRRIGSRQWEVLAQQTESEAVHKILVWRKDYKATTSASASLTSAQANTQ